MPNRWSFFAALVIPLSVWTGRAAADSNGVETTTLLPLVMTGLALLVPVGLTLLGRHAVLAVRSHEFVSFVPVVENGWRRKIIVVAMCAWQRKYPYGLTCFAWE